MYECTEIKKDNVFTVHLCCEVDGGDLVRARINVDLWTQFDKNLSDSIIVEPEEMNSEIVVPIKLFTDDDFMTILARCKNPAEVMILLDTLHLV